MDQFQELMTQVDGGDADQKAYAAMELQTMALDSRSQVGAFTSHLELHTLIFTS